ncbi:MAG: hypothetical protein M5U14_19155 [Acidimicrobiia bacterium]|nr:hypothetical protein [Acidimicrobiia bacterium]
MVALVDDLLDRSRIAAALPGVVFAADVEDCAGADTVVVDLARHGAAVAELRRRLPVARIVAFSPHVDTERAHEAREAGADEVQARSRFFRDVSRAVAGAAPA